MSLFIRSVFQSISFRGILPPKDAGTHSPNPLSSAYFRMNPTFDMLFKGQEQLLKHANAYKNSNRFVFNAQDPLQSPLSRQQSPIEITLSKKSAPSPSPSPSMKKPDDTVQNLSMSANDEDLPDDDEELTAAAAKIPLDEILGKSTFLKDTLRFNCNETTSSVCTLFENRSFHLYL